MSRRYRLERAQLIPRPRADVFRFFSDASNLDRITPPFVHFRIVTPGSLLLEPGMLIDIHLKLYGIPFRWRTRIETFDPGFSFSDVQLSGPYRRWYHRHEFADVTGGTLMRDVVDYELPLGLLGSAAHPILVRPSLRKIFDYRREMVEGIFGR